MDHRPSQPTNPALLRIGGVLLVLVALYLFSVAASVYGGATGGAMGEGGHMAAPSSGTEDVQAAAQLLRSTFVGVCLMASAVAFGVSGLVVLFYHRGTDVAVSFLKVALTALLFALLAYPITGLIGTPTGAHASIATLGSATLLLPATGSYSAARLYPLNPRFPNGGL